jgi:hypothetical protein
MARVEGIDRVKAALRRAKKKMERGVEAGIIEAGLYLQREAQERVPVDTGNLKASASDSHRVSGTAGFETAFRVVFSADYAIYVHENLQAHHTVGEAKYLERAIAANRRTLGQIVRDRAGIR